MTADALLLGQGPPHPACEPPPPAADLRSTGFPVLRLWQGARALVERGAAVAVVAEGPGEPGWRRLKWGSGWVTWRSVPEGGLTAELAGAAADELKAGSVVSVGPFAPARAAAATPPGRPVWIDLPGDPMAEAQLRGEDDPAHLSAYHRVLAAALVRGDAFSVCSGPQRYALIGQLGLMGRLPPETLGAEPVTVLPPGIDPSWTGPAGAPLPGLPDEGPLLALVGSTNTWTDLAATVAALDHALSQREDLHVVVLGGAVPGFSEARHQRLRREVDTRPWGRRVRWAGWVEQPQLLATLDRCAVGLCLDRPCLEAELGARTRLLVGVARGLRWVTTPQAEGARALIERGAAVAAPVGDGVGAGEAILKALAAGRLPPELCHAPAQAAIEAGEAALAAWVARPTRAPTRGGDPWAEEVEARVAAERALAEVHASPLWRTLGRAHRAVKRRRE